MIYQSPHPDVDIPDQSLPSFILEDFAARSAQPALIDGPTGRTLTYGELQKAVPACAGGLAERGLEKGDVFAIYSPNLPEYAIAFYGVARAGGTVTTINPLYTAEEASRQLRDADAKFLLTVPPFLEKAQAAADEAGIDEVFVFGDAEGGGPSSRSCTATTRLRKCLRHRRKTSWRFPTPVARRVFPRASC